jgi:hypothetical protein
MDTNNMNEATTKSLLTIPNLLNLFTQLPFPNIARICGFLFMSERCRLEMTCTKLRNMLKMKELLTTPNTTLIIDHDLAMMKIQDILSSVDHTSNNTPPTTPTNKIENLIFWNSCTLTRNSVVNFLETCYSTIQQCSFIDCESITDVSLRIFGKSTTLQKLTIDSRAVLLTKRNGYNTGARNALPVDDGIEQCAVANRASLKEITFRWSRGFSSKGLSMVLSKCLLLESLMLEWVRLDDVACRNISELVHLKSLELRTCTDITDTGLEYILQGGGGGGGGCCALENLSLVDINISDLTIMELVKHKSHQLKRLHLSDLSKLTKDGVMKALLMNNSDTNTTTTTTTTIFSQLQILHVSHLDIFDDELLTIFFKQCGHLQRVELSWLTNIQTDSPLQILSETNSELICLIIDRVKFSNDGYVKLAVMCKQLLRLEIYQTLFTDVDREIILKGLREALHGSVVIVSRQRHQTLTNHHNNNNDDISMSQSHHNITSQLPFRIIDVHTDEF